VSFPLSEDHRAIRDLVRDFVDREVVPTASERERSGSYPDDLVPQLGTLGVMGMSVPEEYGGSHLDLVSYALVFEELARGWMGLASVVGSSSSGAWLISEYGTGAQKGQYLPALGSGKATSGIALTEPGAGSDVKAIQLRAVPDGDGFVLNGRKTMITHARHADPLVVLARTDASADLPHREMSLFLVEPGVPGYGISRDIDKLGHRGVELCELVFDDARVPESALLGAEPGRGFYQMMSALDRGRIYMAAAATGIAQASLESAVRYAQERSAFGHAIADYQLVKLKIAEMATSVRAARLLTLSAAREIEETGTGSSEAAMAKVFAAEAAIMCSLESMRVLGGYGYTTEFPVERYFRDAPLMAIGEGTNEILRMLVADDVLGNRLGSR
jgi:alkylation response protein AidB-like acyl-CoA dehydrogenase